MPDDRLIHRAFGHSEKINALTDFERNVWFVYKTAADDFGVMRFSPVTLQDAALFLERKPSKLVQRALARIVEVGLVRTFEHQGRAYVYQFDWQTWQKITHPRSTKQPAPPLDALDDNTRWLFQKHPDGGKLSAWKAPHAEPKPTGSKPELKPVPTGNGSGADRSRVGVSGGVSGRRDKSESLSADDVVSERAARFLERYQELYIKHRRGAHYLVRPHLDFPKAKELCAVWDDERLDKLATIFLLTDHEFAESGSRTIGQFAALASWCDGRLAEAGIA